MATVFEPKTALTVRVLQSITVTQKDPGFRFKAWDQDFGMEAAPQLPLPDLSRSWYARHSPVVVLQDGTVGTVMVPKQT